MISCTSGKPVLTRSLVAALEAFDRQVRVDVAQRVGAAFQFRGSSSRIGPSSCSRKLQSDQAPPSRV